MSVSLVYRSYCFSIQRISVWLALILYTEVIFRTLSSGAQIKYSLVKKKFKVCASKHLQSCNELGSWFDVAEARKKFILRESLRIFKHTESESVNDITDKWFTKAVSV